MNWLPPGCLRKIYDRLRWGERDLLKISQFLQVISGLMMNFLICTFVISAMWILHFLRWDVCICCSLSKATRSNQYANVLMCGHQDPSIWVPRDDSLSPKRWQLFCQHIPRNICFFLGWRRPYCSLINSDDTTFFLKVWFRTLLLILWIFVLVIWMQVSETNSCE